MKLGVLFSGGKDSTLALIKAKEHHKIECLITLVSENKESFMFHTPNIDLTKLQAEALKLPLVRVETKGQKEAELKDLRKALESAKRKYKIQGVVTGAVRSTYQATRIQQICHELNLWCFNPLWLMDQVQLLNEVLKRKMKVIISGVFAEPLDKSYVGKLLDKAMVAKLAKASETHGINPAGEGGEIETTVLFAPGFKKKLDVKGTVEHANFAGTFKVSEAKLV
jgi:ABC transporter with metal-binding/Fe-S-binding domain ATP-binding protein